MVYEVVYKADDGESVITEEVSEKDLAYGANCPVTIEYPGDGSTVNGTVLLGRPSSKETSRFVYTVMVMMGDGSQAFVRDVDASRELVLGK